MIIDVSSNRERVDRNLISVNRSIEDLGKVVNGIENKVNLFSHMSLIKTVYKDLILLSDLVYEEEYKIEENLELILKFTKIINSKLTYRNILARYYGRETTMFLTEQW